VTRRSTSRSIIETFFRTRLHERQKDLTQAEAIADLIDKPRLNKPLKLPALRSCKGLFKTPVDELVKSP